MANGCETNSRSARFCGMRVLIRNRDLQTLCKGAAFAVAAGLLMGAAMQPNLDVDEFEGPQILLSGGGVRAEPARYDSGMAAYGPKLPEHVIGTDYTKPRPAEALLVDDEGWEAHEPTSLEEAHAAPVVVYEAAEARDAPASPPWADEPRSRPLYPSERGNTYYASDLPAPPEPPPLEDWVPAAT